MNKIYFSKSPNTRGIRNNNPFNIVRSSSRWLGKVDSTDKKFEQFSNMEYGVRAGVLLLRNYIRKSRDSVSRVPINTLSRIINRFAPCSDGNDTESYISFVQQYFASSLGESISRDYVFKYPSSEFATLCCAIMFYESQYFVPESHIYYIINKFKIY